MMIYYRIAVQENETSKWIWKSTAVTSLVAVLHLLRMYSPIPAQRIRVFSSTSIEELAEMLNRENDGLVSGSLTAGEFLRERRLSVQNEAASNTIEKLVQRSIAVAVDSSARNDSPASNLASMGSINLLDQRRLHMESGAGGDHDMPYRFALPTSTPQLLAWTRLMSKVQAGEVQP
jgi:hypothetical protein